MAEFSRAARKVLYGLTIFLSAFLLFVIQPMFAKRILPWFGGSAAVWTTCLVFFQTALLAGYYYAHVASRRLSARGQAILHTILIAAALTLLPAIPGDKWRPSASGDPSFEILAMMTAVLGLPYFLLSTTNPLLQNWFSRSGSEPYRFFALSNVGAFIALGAYPFAIEPAISLASQSAVWSAGFALLAALLLLIAWTDGQRGLASAQKSSAAPQTPEWTWFLLAAAGSIMLVSTTNQLTQNVAAVPFLWILPLSLYLLSFIVTFESTRWYKRQLFLRLLAVALASVAYAAYDIKFSDAIIVAIPLYSIAMFVVCMFCHGELSMRKPEASQLTSFYLMIALGGAVGAIFTGLLAPRIFSGIYELQVALVIAAALALWLNWSSGWSQRLLWVAVMLTMIIALGEVVAGFDKDAVLKKRSFYGSLRVVDKDGVRSLFHGTVKHGSQFLSPEKRGEPASYYGPRSGVAIALRTCCPESEKTPKRVGIIGLGTGTLAAFGKPGDQFRFYEINPQVIEIARSQFTFLSDSKAAVDISLGDARLSLEREPSQFLDVLVGDAFSGDAIPMHLLTKEAFAVYDRVLKPRGVLVFHVSNSYLDLAPVVAQLAGQYHLTVRQVLSFGDESRALARAVWVLAARDEMFFHEPEVFSASSVIPQNPRLRLWTDNYNNLFDVIRLF